MVLGYINHCTDTVTVDKYIWVYPNTKPWMTKKVLRLLRERDTAFRSGDRALNSAASVDLKRGIREAKAAQRTRIEDCFQSNNPRQVWQGVQHMTNYRPSNLSATDGDTSLVEERNHFLCDYDCFLCECLSLFSLSLSPRCSRFQLLITWEGGLAPRWMSHPLKDALLRKTRESERARL